MRREANVSHSQERSTDGELKCPDWRFPLQELILEYDREKFRNKPQNVEGFIRDRFLQFDQENNTREERQALHDTLSTLRIIKPDRMWGTAVPGGIVFGSLRRER